MKRNGCSFSNLTGNTFVLYFSTKKRMVENEKKNLFLMNGDIFQERQGIEKFILCEW